MPSALETLRDVLAEWLKQEEAALSEWSGTLDDPHLTGRLQVWGQRLRAYERVERALASGQVAADRETHREALPEPVERGLFLVA